MCRFVPGFAAEHMQYQSYRYSSTELGRMRSSTVPVQARDPTSTGASTATSKCMPILIDGSTATQVSWLAFEPVGSSCEGFVYHGRCCRLAHTYRVPRYNGMPAPGALNRCTASMRWLSRTVALHARYTPKMYCRRATAALAGGVDVTHAGHSATAGAPADQQGSYSGSEVQVTAPAQRQSWRA